MKNQSSVNRAALIVLVSLLGTSGGCATLCGVSDDCSCALDCGDCCLDQNCEPGCGTGIRRRSEPSCGSARFCGKRHCPLCRGDHCRIVVGPPAVRYQPEMPPEFLPVPVTPIVANVNPDAPPTMRGAVESGWAPPCQLTVYGRD